MNISCKIARPNLPPLGIEEKLVNEAPISLPIIKGMRLTAYSDGLTDMTDPFGERYGEEKTIELLRDVHKTPLSEVSQKLDEEVNRWIGESHLADDITLVDIRF